MACQNCGRVSETRLCCPTCIELGRTTFFCGQECFASSWPTHNKLHESIRRAKGSSAAAAEEGRVGSLGVGIVPTAKRGLANGASVWGGLVDQAWSVVSSSVGDAVASAAAVAGGAASSYSGASARPLKMRTRTRSPAPRPAGGAGATMERKNSGAAVGSPSGALGRSKLQLSLVGLVVVTIFGGGLFYLEHQRYALPADGTWSVEAMSVNTVMESSKATLRSEINSLKELVQRNDQMLRHISDILSSGKYGNLSNTGVVEDALKFTLNISKVGGISRDDGTASAATESSAPAPLSVQLSPRRSKHRAGEVIETASLGRSPGEVRAESEQLQLVDPVASASAATPQNTDVSLLPVGVIAFASVATPADRGIAAASEMATIDTPGGHASIAMSAGDGSTGSSELMMIPDR